MICQNSSHVTILNQVMIMSIVTAYQLVTGWYNLYIAYVIS